MDSGQRGRGTGGTGQGKGWSHGTTAWSLLNRGGLLMVLLTRYPTKHVIRYLG